MSFCVSHRADREESSDRGQQGRGQEAEEAEAQQAVKEAAKEEEEEEEEEEKEEGEEEEDEAAGKWILQLCKEVPPPLRGEVAQASFVAARRKCALSFR